jgi:hypothetical protein
VAEPVGVDETNRQTSANADEEISRALVDLLCGRVRQALEMVGKWPNLRVARCIRFLAHAFEFRNVIEGADAFGGMDAYRELIFAMGFEQHFLWAYGTILNKAFPSALERLRTPPADFENDPFLLFGRAFAELRCNDLPAVQETLRRMRQKTPGHPLIGLFEKEFLCQDESARAPYH